MKHHPFLYSSCIIILLFSSVNIVVVASSSAATSAENNNNNNNDNNSIKSSSNLRRGGSRRSLQNGSVGRPNIIDSNPSTNNSTTTSSYTAPEPYKEDPFISNVNDFINTTHNIINSQTTYSPTTFPTSSPGPTWIQRSQPSNPTLSIPTAWNNNNPPVDRSSTTNNNNNVDDTDFKEFIAFVGWYAFLILCCILPTICTYYKRRRNAYLLSDNINSIRLRLEEMERQSGGGSNGVLGSVNGVGMWNEGSVIRLGERDRDWEFLEQLFSSSNDATTTTTNHRYQTPTLIASGDDSAERRRQIMADILGGVSVRNVMEREQRRKRERGRRLVGLLKECSLEVEKCHLVLKEGVVDDGGRAEEEVGGGDYGANHNEGEGDIELGTIQHTVHNDETDGVNSKGGENCDDEALESSKGCATANEGSQEVKNDVIEELSPRKGGDEESCQPTNADDETNDEAAIIANDVPDSSITTLESAATTTTALPPTDQAIDGVNNTQSSLLPSAAADNSTTTRNNNNNILSLYQTDDILDDDDDDDDNKYSALCLPCTPTHKDATTTTLSVARSAPPQSAAIDNIQSSNRLVPPTCAICLLSYSPGCYVTWSSNPECIHVFHRDCILVWLLKKEEPLCPCCRREFVSSSILNTESPTTTSGGGGDNEDSVDEYRRTLILQRSQALATRQRLARLHHTPPPWDSLSTGRVRHF